ncbi:SDR family oxidoreductase [Novosphingobium resinovorum]|uniref:SDR family NAD(P)-dependent oxidoreductase n=1 Tax=Novosphingobium TaxID=165696 RepID=UPI001B3C969D|nr:MULTISPECIES: SDR family oxidoreductase [Novosphingobium]MBF7014789.1 SDR family oxidoreductase [Novosphingobium sp. HR1a]WJM24726.1 SDR family oxidoreductase [Novosphingobium resinovorum]
MSTFEGKTALIIGAGQNIGRQIALEWARRGARVAVADISRDGAEETAELVRALGAESTGLHCNVLDEASVLEAIDAAEAALGPLDIHMNNAGILSGGNPEDIPLAEWQRMFDVNLFGMVRANAIVVPRMMGRGEGHIVNTASFAGLYPFAASRIHYAASKAAVLSMSQNLALYLMQFGIRVSCLCPGPVMTTSPDAMKHFSEDYTMRAPGSHLFVKSQPETARILSDAMEGGEIVVPTHEEVWTTLAEVAANPDAFIEKKHAEFMAGDPGKPGITQAVIDSIRG